MKQITRFSDFRFVCNKLELMTRGVPINKYYSESKIKLPVSEFNEFEPRLKSAKNRFQLRAGLNLEKLNTILNETNHI